MECPAFIDLKFSQASKDAIKKIRSMQEVADLPTAAIGYGTWVNIFAGGSGFQAAY